MHILRNCPMLRFERDYYILKEEITVAIKRHQTVIDTLFTGVVMFLVTIGTLCIGCDLEIEQIVHSIKQPIPLIVGLACQLIYLPLLSLLMSKLFQLDNPTSLGLISTASSPGKF
jgi:predicted Na+-dependent transporter